MQTPQEVAIECLEARKISNILCGRNRFLYNLKIMSRQRVLEMTGKMFEKVAG